MAKPIHIVLTTINFPTVVRSIRDNARIHGHLDQTKIWIVGDVKTPKEVAALAIEVTETGLETVYLDLPAQDAMSGVFGSFVARLPLNNECRRNLGYLAALQDGCEILLAMDDDNFPVEEDLIGGHLQTGRGWAGDVLTDPSGYYNVCEHLVMEPKRPIYPRGFPFRLRSSSNQPQRAPAKAGVRIGVTAGLWLRDPDIDATTWLNGKVQSVKYCGDPSNVLAQECWTPINTQNTSVVRELIPAFLCVPMGWDAPGGKIQRYGDIWGGYFLEALLPGTRFHVAFGAPVVDHRRNPHDYLDDLRGEYWGLLLTDWLVGQLRTRFNPAGDDMTARVEGLGRFLSMDAIRHLPAWCPGEVTGFLEWTAGNLLSWAEACRKASA